MIFLTQPSLIIQYIMISFDIDLIYYKGPRIKNKTTFFSFRSPWTCDLKTYSKNIGTRNWDINGTTKELVIIFFLVLYFRVFQRIFWRQLQKKKCPFTSFGNFCQNTCKCRKDEWDIANGCAQQRSTGNINFIMWIEDAQKKK